MTRNWLLMELRPYVSMLSLPYSALGPLYLSNKKTKKKHLVYWKVVHVKTASDSVWRNAFSVFQVRSIYLDLLSRPPVLAKEKDVTNFPSRDALWSAKGEKSSIASVCAWNAGQQHLENCEDYKVQWKLYPQLDIIGYLMLCFFFPVKVCCRISLGSPMKSPLSLVCLLEKADLTVSEKHPKPKQWSFEIYIDIIRSFRFKALSLVILVSRNCWFCVAKLIFSWKVECSWPLLLRISRLLLSSFLTFFSIRQNL